MNLIHIIDFQRSIMNVACDYEAPMQMLTTEKYIAAGQDLPAWGEPPTWKTKIRKIKRKLRKNKRKHQKMREKEEMISCPSGVESVAMPLIMLMMSNILIWFHRFVGLYGFHRSDGIS